MLLNGHQDLGAGRRLEDSVAVDRLDGCHVDDAHRTAGRIEAPGDLDGGVDRQAASDDRQLLAAGVLYRLAENEIGRRVVEIRLSSSSGPEIDRPVMVDAGTDRRLELRAIGGRNDRQIGDRPHRANVLGRMVGRTVEAHGDTGVMADQPHRQCAIGDIHPDLLAGKQSEERCESSDIGEHAGRGDPGRRRHHVLLRYSEADITVWITRGKTVEAIGVLQIGRSRHDGMTLLD